MKYDSYKTVNWFQIVIDLILQYFETVNMFQDNLSTFLLNINK